MSNDRESRLGRALRRIARTKQPIAPSDVAFLICVEANQLEQQALMLCASIRRFGGRYRNSPIVAVAPREHLWLSRESQQRLESMDVTYVALPLNATGSTYGTINRIVVGAWAEATLAQPYLVLLDTDTVFVSEPRFVMADFGARPVDMKGSATKGPTDPLDAYWVQLAAFADIDIERLPMLRTSIDGETIRASYNGGFTVVRRSLGILELTKRIFFAAFDLNLRPSPGTQLDVKASTGFVGSEASEWWGSSQAALSIAVWATTADVHLYDATYNIPAHALVDAAQPWPTVHGQPPVLVHYHYLAEPQHQQHLNAVLQRLGTTPEAIEWVSESLTAFGTRAATVCFCTMAIHQPYRRLARLLCADAPTMSHVVLTDEPADFADMPVRAIAHVPTGPMAVDYVERLNPTGDNRGAAAYHDKRFALLGALQNHDTAIFLDADSRIGELPPLGPYPPGICVLPVVRATIAEHLRTTGAWRLTAFIALAEHLTGDANVLQAARWCHEACVAITKDGNESVFFDLWDRSAAFMQARDVFSGEGGVIGLAAHITGWSVDYESLLALGATVRHDGGGPKVA